MIAGWAFIFFIISVLLTGGIYRYALSNNMLDVPNERSAHSMPTPRGGGIAVVSLFIAATLGLYLRHHLSLALFCALSGGTVVALLGWLDDVFSLSSSRRIIFHLLSAIWGAYWLLGLPFSVWTAIIFSLAVVSIVWCINLYNFMDGIDGLAGGEGLFISLAGALILSFLGATWLSILYFLLAAMMGGFLIWNWPRAKIFMGDVGSGYLGYIFAVLAIATIQAHLIASFVWLTLAAVFLCDTTFTLLHRIYHGKRWYEAHCEHAYQCLVRAGWNHQRVTVNALLLDIFVLFPIACMMIAKPQWQIFIAVFGFLSLLLLWYKIKRIPI